MQGWFEKNVQELGKALKPGKINTKRHECTGGSCQRNPESLERCDGNYKNGKEISNGGFRHQPKCRAKILLMLQLLELVDAHILHHEEVSSWIGRQAARRRRVYAVWREGLVLCSPELRDIS